MGRTRVTCDLLVVGGGINGCAIAREAAIAGWSVLLVERDDLAAHTSSASTKLIHGGLRYLESYAFRLVAEALAERERLWRAAPHLIRPMRFVLPHEHAVRPWWMVRAGLWLYDRLGRANTLPRSRSLRAGDDVYRAPLRSAYRGFVYSDAYVDDARLTLANAIDAAENGATISTRCALSAAERTFEGWRATLSDGHQVTARVLVNAAGPWVADLLGRIGVETRSRVRLVKGSHIVLPCLYAGDHAYLFQQRDRRIVFALPYAGGTAIGTTDVPVATPEDAHIDAGEIAYLCAAADAHFRASVSPADMTSSWSGVRPLWDDGSTAAQAVTRDYHLELDADGAPALSVFGGKITTARALAEDAVARVAPLLGRSAGVATRDRPFPGGDIRDFDAFLAEVRIAWPFLGDARALRMARAYGTRLRVMLASVRTEADMGAPLGAGLTAVEARWMRTREWATTPADALERRSRLGLAMSDAERRAFDAWWTADTASSPSSA